MSKSLEQACLTKNGGKQYYIQFHIKPWMRRLPWFKNYGAQYPKRKNVKESLHTASLYEALQRLHKRLHEIGLSWSDESNSLMPVPAKESPPFREDDEYFKTLDELHLLSDDQFRPQLDPEHPDASVLLRDLEVAIFMNELEVDVSGSPQPSQHQLIAKHTARMKAFDRVERKEDQKQFPEPHPYETTLLSAAALLVREYKADHRAIKDTGKINTACKKFLAWLGQDDIPLKDITHRHAKNYVRYARDARIPKNTFSAEIGKLKQIYDMAMEEGRLSTHGISPFSNADLKGFEPAKAKAIYSPQHAETLAKEAAAKKRKDILINVGVSYYTGMRSSELFECTLEEGDGIHYFRIKEGKTVSSNRYVPLHSHLVQWLEEGGSLPSNGSGFDWASPTRSEFNKAFNRFSNTYLLTKHGITGDEGTLSHHSFRHGMSTRLFEAGYNEIEVAHVIGHSGATVARTEAGRTYIKKASLSVLRDRINSIPQISLPAINEASGQT
jgi:site-specific recombinase XerD